MRNDGERGNRRGHHWNGTKTNSWLDSGQLGIGRFVWSGECVECVCGYVVDVVLQVMTVLGRYKGEGDFER